MESLYYIDNSGSKSSQQPPEMAFLHFTIGFEAAVLRLEIRLNFNRVCRSSEILSNENRPRQALFDKGRIHAVRMHNEGGNAMIYGWK